MKRLFLLVLCLSFLFRFTPVENALAQAEPGAGGEGESAKVRTAAWISYTHEPWGLTFHYPADWQLVAPDFEALAQPPKDLPEGYTFNPDMDVLRTIGHGLTLYPPNSGPAGGVKIEIGLEEFLLSSETTLEEWMLLDRAYDAAGLGNPQTAQTSYRSDAPPVEQWPSDAAQFLHQIGEREGFRGDVYWIAVGELVYTVSTVDAGDDVLAQLRQMIASFAFDKAVQEKLRATAPFSGSEQEMIRLTERFAPPQGETCDIVCRDQKEMEQTLAEPPEELAPPGAPAETDQPSMNQKALPANWFTPLGGVYVVNCGSSWHIGNAEFAVDASAAVGAPVYAMYAGNASRGYEQNGYGKYILISTPLGIADEQRTYYHAYAHLNEYAVANGLSVTTGQLIGYSGNTGNSLGPHLHFHIRDSNNNPVDATPVLGFKPNLSYPTLADTECGKMVISIDDPVVIESVAFTARIQRNNYYWYCINPQYSTVECYMRALPDNEGWFDYPQNTAPEVQYSNVYFTQWQNPSNWYVWVCGHANNDGRDDSLFLGVSGTPSTIPLISQAQWEWLSIRHQYLDRPTISAYNTSTINVWMREDGARYSRLLLTRDANYNPNGNIKCGPYQ